MISYVHINAFFSCSLYYLKTHLLFSVFVFPQWTRSWIFISFKDIFLCCFISVVIVLMSLFLVCYCFFNAWSLIFIFIISSLLIHTFNWIFLLALFHLPIRSDFVILSILNNFGFHFYLNPVMLMLEMSVLFFFLFNN